MIPPATPAGAAPATPGWRFDLLAAFPPLKWLVRRRWFQYAVVLPNLLLFVMFLTAGVLGSPVGNRNIIIIFVWILWWFLLISVLVPFVSRVWCTVCPFPFFGEWAQRRALIGVRAIDPKDPAQKKGGPGTIVGRNRYFGLNWRWPKALSNIWLQNIGFLALCTFSALFLTRPIVSVIVLGSLFVIATGLHLLFRQRAFCDYVCPVSGFLSLYAMTSTVEVRSKSQDVCAKCTDKGCLAGSESGWGCPWLMYPSKMDRNNYCGLCMECVKTCPHDNMTLRLRPFASDRRLKGYDEAWKAFIMLSLAVTYSLVYLGPWAVLKDWANIAESGAWGGFLTYAALLWTTSLLIVPGLYAAVVALGRTLAGHPSAEEGGAPPLKTVFLALVFPLVPLGLLTWIAFSFPLVLVNGSYILMTMSDPFGWGWNLFGTADLHWTPVLPHWTPYVQAVLLLIGLWLALRTGFAQAAGLYQEPRRSVRAFLPAALVLTGLVACFLMLYLG